MERILEFVSETFMFFLVVKCSVYLNRRVFVMRFVGGAGEGVSRLKWVKLRCTFTANRS